MCSKKTEDLNLGAFNMITGISESKTLAKHISCECKCTWKCGIFNKYYWRFND